MMWITHQSVRCVAGVFTTRSRSDEAHMTAHKGMMLQKFTGAGPSFILTSTCAVVCVIIGTWTGTLGRGPAGDVVPALSHLGGVQQ